MYIFLADVVAFLHFVYVAFVVVGLLLIVAGIVFRWEWIRNRWFRSLHLAMIGVVALEAVVSFRCPLTDLECWLYEQGGRTVHEGSFIGRLINNVLFINLDVDHPLFRYVYIGFAVLVLATFVLAPPRWRKRSAGQSGAMGEKETAEPTGPAA